MVPQQGTQRKESFSLKLTWLCDRVRQMPQTDDLETLRQYARCCILLLIGGYLMTDKSNNLVHLQKVPIVVSAEIRWGRGKTQRTKFSAGVFDQLNLEDDKDNDGSSNNAMEDMDANQNERNVDQAPNLSYEDIDDDFELTLWT
ncbi:hypothetical protein Ahy_B02g060476 isoform E [Arachis hypogaea]|uniref:Aminotransferase-like plant mobile domain-containing protein n=1 Tax=Arachis hypogaea TaxID=3818 RepID=A0A445AIK8_ARAHY|nr:hypothetical protein Ahy_B02g060476 isoform E [Arachis hypogaea]